MPFSPEVGDLLGASVLPPSIYTHAHTYPSKVKPKLGMAGGSILRRVSEVQVSERDACSTTEKLGAQEHKAEGASSNQSLQMNEQRGVYSSIITRIVFYLFEGIGIGQQGPPASSRAASRRAGTGRQKSLVSQALRPG